MDTAVKLVIETLDVITFAESSVAVVKICPPNVALLPRVIVPLLIIVASPGSTGYVVDISAKSPDS